MGAALIPILLILAIVVVLVAGVVAVNRRQRDRLDTARQQPAAEVLRYLVPEGQDATILVAALRTEGYDAVSDGDEVIVTPRADRDRERAHVRSVIASAPLNPEGDRGEERQVRFVDEQ